MSRVRTEIEQSIASRYRRFAHNEARGQSALYEGLAEFVAESDRMLTFLASLPKDRQQPNLLFAAVRNVVGLPSDGKALVDAIDREGSAVSAVMKSRTTQTNEPGRCAVLLPVLARLPQPIAIVEVGASAGLCLLPDRYGYDYGRCRIEAPNETRACAPAFPSECNELTPLPRNLPDIQWRRGLDLNPLDVASISDMEWLETLVWPEQQGRRERLRAAIEVARRDPPMVARGDLLKDLETVLRQVPPGLTTVIFHTAVLAYVNERGRQQFRQAMLESGAVWISNEAPGVFPEIASKLSSQVRHDRFLLCVDDNPVAWAAPHGQSLDWIGNG